MLNTTYNQECDFASIKFQKRSPWADRAVLEVGLDGIKRGLKPAEIQVEVMENCRVAVSAAQVSSLKKRIKAAQAKAQAGDTEAAPIENDDDSGLETQPTTEKRDLEPPETAPASTDTANSLTFSLPRSGAALVMIPPKADDPPNRLRFQWIPSRTVEIPTDPEPQKPKLEVLPYPNSRQTLHRVNNPQLLRNSVNVLMSLPNLPDGIRELLSIDPVSRCGHKGMIRLTKLACLLRQISRADRYVKPYATAKRKIINSCYDRCQGCSNFLTDGEYHWLVAALKAVKRIQEVA